MRPMVNLISEAKRIIMVDAPDLLKDIGVDGLSFHAEGNYHISVNPDVKPYKKSFIMAHELGHILLGHLDGEQLSGERRRTAEAQADIFAAVLIALDAVFNAQTE